MPFSRVKRKEQHPATEEFMLNTYKVVPCNKRYPHNWKRCPFAHEGEAARRRDPLTHAYSDVMCPESRKGQKCPRGESCPFTHNLFEYWLLPSRFKTQLCSKKDECKRPFCFFAHFDEELRDPVRVDEVPSGSMSNCDVVSMLHDSFGSHMCFPMSNFSDQGYLENQQLQAGKEFASNQSYHQSNIWEFFEPNQPPMPQESMLPLIDQRMSGSPPLSRSDCLESSLHQQLLIDNLQAGLYPMLDHAENTHFGDQPVVPPSLQILQSLCAGRNFI